MDLRFISTLVAVVEEGTLAAAARADGITPSAVTQRIATLEAHLQVPLLLRAGRSMQPTPQCQAILPRLRHMLRDAAALKSDLQAEALQGPFRLGAISTAIADSAAQLVLGMRNIAPEVELQLIPGASSALFAEFEKEKLDAALIVKPEFHLPKSMQFIPLHNQTIGWLTPVNEAVSELPFILYSREAWGGRHCWTALRERDPTPRILAEMDALESIAQMVSDGLGRSILPRWKTMDRYAPNVRFEGIAGLYRELGILCWRRDRDHPVQILLRQLLKSVD